jgi:hypothetical protein
MLIKFGILITQLVTDTGAVTWILEYRLHGELGWAIADG